MSYTTPDTADVPLRVVVFERAADGSPGYRIFHARKVSVGPDSILYKRVSGGFEYVESGDVLTEEPTLEEES